MSLTRTLALFFIFIVPGAYGFELTLEYEPVYFKGYSKKLTLTCPENSEEPSCSFGHQKISKAAITSTVDRILQIEKSLSPQTSPIRGSKSLRVSYRDNSMSFRREFGALTAKTTQEARILQKYRRLLDEFRQKLRGPK